MMGYLYRSKLKESYVFYGVQTATHREVSFRLKKKTIKLYPRKIDNSPTSHERKHQGAMFLTKTIVELGRH